MPKCEVEFDSLPEKLGKNCNNNIDIFFLRYFDLKPVKPNGCLGTLVPSTTNGETEMRMVPSFYRVFTEFLVLLSLSLSPFLRPAPADRISPAVWRRGLSIDFWKRERERERDATSALGGASALASRRRRRRRKKAKTPSLPPAAAAAKKNWKKIERERENDEK